MKLRIFIFSLLLSSSLFGEPASDIAAPQKRTEVLDLARKLLTTKSVETSVDDIARKNPFNPLPVVVESSGPDKADSPAPVVVGTSDRDILAAIAEGVRPTGTMKLGDTQFLLFGQKKLKVGDVLPIVFQDTSYELELVGVDRTSFTLRLNKEEITRPIKL
ncbi:hypothetical protein [Rariglobus hedericola]|uniref:Copper chaperone PCu(A)C n=1 Tax=Rariglobus hedericola TaxID=2597822 RepID=A0A556QRF3_9BACT|nr:hypothetical protein [Rariglobus hedericola]TSJ79220.1 hypothetical protein FPL22_07985 [Rariglobus hedericola]